MTKSTTKIALITGGSRGLGRDMALALARKGNDVIFTYNANKEAAEKVASEIKSFGRKVSVLKLDTSNTKKFDDFSKQLSQYLLAEYGTAKFDYLINNAGTALYAPLADVTEDQIDNIFNIHYKAAALLTQKILPFMNDGGGIVNVSSGLTRITMAGYSIYGSLKAAVETLSRYMAVELGPRKIRVNVVAPGAIETDFGGGHVRDNKELNNRIASVTALGRVGVPDDIGKVVAFLCSEDAGWINGQRIEISGGQAL